MCMSIRGEHSRLLLSAHKVLPHHPLSCGTGLYRQPILWHVKPGKNLQSSFSPESDLPIQSERDGCWGTCVRHTKQRSEHNNVTPPTSLQSCAIRGHSYAAQGKNGLIGLLGLDLGVGSSVLYRHYSRDSQCSHKMVVSKRQAQMFSAKPSNMKLSGQVFLYA